MKQLAKIKSLLDGNGFELFYKEGKDVLVYKNASITISIDADDKHSMRDAKASIMRVITQANCIRELNYYYCIGSSFYLINIEDYKKHINTQIPAYGNFMAKQPNELYMPKLDTLKDGWDYLKKSININT